ICNFNKNTCTDSPVDFPDMIENYMDYAQDGCMNLFTQDQADIMRSMLETARTDLADGSVPPTGIDENTIAASEVSVFPNPSNGEFQVQFSKDLNLENIELIDLKGRHVQSFSSQNLAANGSMNYPNAKSGAYMLKLTFTEGTIVKRLFIQ
ncbi:MAG: zinc-dependent metalloprotease, partial [Flavobacteriales bacterium]